MKFVQCIYAIVILIFAGRDTVFGETFPQTNVLTSEIKVAPPAIAVGGQFGQSVAGKSSVFVASFDNAPEQGTNKPLAAVFRKTVVGLEQQATLSVPTQANLSLQDLSTDGNQIALFGLEGDTSVIYIFGRQQEEWGLETRLLPSETIRSISISEGVMVAGAAFKALLFELKDGAWIESQILPPSDIPTIIKNGFGAAAVVNHDTILITATGDERSEPGRAYVYARDGTAWRLQADLRPEYYIYAKFGTAVALDEDTALISVFSNLYHDGWVYLFLRSAGAWTRVGDFSGVDHQEWFGRSVAVSGRNLVVGAPWGRGGSGCVYLFRRNGFGFDRLILFRNDTFHDPLGFGDSLGFDVAADDNSLFLSAPYHDSFADNGGAAFLFNFEFPPMLESAWARLADNSFHFNIADTKVGQTYNIQTTSAFDSEWITLKQLIADRTTTQVEVDIPSGPVGFFRVSNPQTSTEANR